LHKTLAQCYGQLGQADRVIEHLQRAIELTPEDADAHYNLGLEYQAQNRSADAIALLRKAVDLAPGDDEYRLAFGRICAESGQYALAEPLLQQLLGTREHDSAHILLVQCWLLQGRTKDAEDLATRAVCEQPGSAVALVALSVVLRKTRRLMESAEALERARGIDPANAWVQWALEESHNA